MSANFTPNQNQYENLTPFKKWLVLQINTWGMTNFPFVESDFDELTNYAMMQKLMNAVNDVIENENLVEQDMTNLFGAFTELQNYVNTYFENLDVQDEINNKLDDLVEDGTLTTLISNYVNPYIDEQNERISEAITLQNTMITSINAKVDNISTGKPLVASSTSGMTDTTRIYVNTTDENWYYYNGTTWVIGGKYIPDEKTLDDNVIVKEFDESLFTSNVSTTTMWGQFKNPVPASYLKQIKTYINSADNSGYAYVCVLNDNNTSFTIYKKIPFTSVSGLNTIEVNEYIPHKYFIGIQCIGLRFYAGDNFKSIGIDTSSSFDVGYTHNMGGEVHVVLGTYVIIDESFKLVNKLNRIPQAQVYSANRVKHLFNFDFVTNKLKIDNCNIINNIKYNNDITYTNIQQNIDITPLDTSCTNHYYVLYNMKAGTIRVLYAKNDVQLNTIGINESLVCGISVIVGNSIDTTTYSIIHPHINDKYVYVKIKDATSTDNEVISTIETTRTNKIAGRFYKALGDSITRGEDPTDSYNPMLNNRYTDIVAKNLGLQAFNYGVGGSRIAVTAGRSDSMWERRNVGPSFIYSIMGGTNDYAVSVPMGTENDGDYTHFAYAFDQLVRFYMVGTYFFVITPIRRENGGVANSVGLTLEDYVNKEIEICKKYGVPVLDLYHSGLLNPDFSSWKNSFVPDGIHPNTKGMDIIANRITSFIKELVNFDSNQKIVE